MGVEILWDIGVRVWNCGCSFQVVVFELFDVTINLYYYFIPKKLT